MPELFDGSKIEAVDDRFTIARPAPIAWAKSRAGSLSSPSPGVASIDPDAAPLDIDWTKARLVIPPGKDVITFRLDRDVLDWLRAQGGLPDPYQPSPASLVRRPDRAGAARKGRGGPEGGGKERSEKSRRQAISEKGRSRASQKARMTAHEV
jgi:hypothetical protein